MGKMVKKNILSVYSGRRVMITGHTGFKGSWLAYLLHEVGAEVVGYALSPVGNISHFSLLELDKLIQHVVGDMADQSILASTMQEFQPEFVFHLAAQALVRPSYDDPRGTFNTNVMGSINLLEAVRQCSTVRSLVYITSDKCYENLEWVWGYRENDRLGGYDPYSASKAAAEIAFSAYSRSFFSGRPELGAATTRAGNVIGGGDWAKDRIVPDCIRSMQSDKPIELRNPAATRPWQHVLEPLSGYLMLGAYLYDEPADYTGAWNFGPPSSEIRTVLEVAERIVDHFGYGEIVAEPSLARRHEAQLLQLNCDKAHQVLGWKPRWDVETTLLKTAEWYKLIQDGVEPRSVTKQQLVEYFPELL